MGLLLPGAWCSRGLTGGSWAEVSLQSRAQQLLQGWATLVMRWAVLGWAWDRAAIRSSLRRQSCLSHHTPPHVHLHHLPHPPPKPGVYPAPPKVLSPADVALYGGLCALATFDRSEMQSKVIGSIGFREFLELHPQVGPVARVGICWRWSCSTIRLWPATTNQESWRAHQNCLLDNARQHLSLYLVPIHLPLASSPPHTYGLTQTLFPLNPLTPCAYSPPPACSSALLPPRSLPLTLSTRCAT